MTDHVRMSIDSGVMTVTLARPDKKNALTNAMYGALADALDLAEQDSAVRSVLFEAEGDAFTAGNDLGDFAAVAGGRLPPSELRATAFLEALMSAKKPYVAAVQGSAVGIGVTVLLHCDMVFVAEDARLATPFVNLGLVPEAASSLLLPLRIGYARAFAMLALGEPVTGRTAATLGLANVALPQAEVQPAARAAARALAARPASALRATKQLMRDTNAISAVMSRESTLFWSQLQTPEAAEALRAFMQRR